MNYYERHIGDYIRDTVSLTMLEDGAYNRLMDQYYQSERPLPADRKMIYRLARAMSTAERKAVDFVLDTFFAHASDGYVQKRIQAEIERYWDRDRSNETKRENDRERQNRSRARRKALFDELRTHGIVPDFNTPTGQLATELSRVTRRDNNANVAFPVTCDSTYTQTPGAKHQNPAAAHTAVPPPPREPACEALPAHQEPPEPAKRTRATEVSVLLRELGVQGSTPFNPHVTGMANDPGVTDAVLQAACELAQERKPGVRVGVAYIAAVVPDLAHPKPVQPRPGFDDWSKSDAATLAKAGEVGIAPRAGEDWKGLRDRIWAAIRRRDGRAA